MADESAVLTPPPGPIVQVDPAQVDPLSYYSPAQQQPPQQPQPAPGNELDTLAQDPNQQPGYVPQGNELDSLAAQSQPGTTPPSRDAEMTVGAAHQNVMAKFLHSALDALGGTVTHRVVKDPDGTYSVHLDESTDKEKWGRIAAAVLGGAAKGRAVGQGPGGGARAVAGGFDVGQNQQQKLSDQATADAKAQNENLTMKANHAMTDQQIAALTYTNQMNPIHTAQEAAEWDIKMQDLGGEMIANPKNPKEIATFSKGNPDLLNGHFSADGSVLVPLPQSDGSLKIWRIPPDMAKRKYPADFNYETPKLQPDGTLKTVTTNVPAYTKTGAEIALLTKQNMLDSNAAVKSSLEIQNTQKETAIKDREARLKENMAPLEAAQKRAQTGQAWSEVTLNNSKNEVIQNTLKQRPGGAPTEVEDPDFPSPNNFPVGTLGIAKPPKSGDYKVPAEAEKAYRLSLIMKDSGNLIRQTAAANPQLFGKFQGLLSQGKTLVGLSASKDDQALATLAGAVQQYAASSAGFHTFRNKSMPAETEESALRKFRNDPASVVAFLDSQNPAIAQTERLIKNYQVYGTPQGPSDEAREAGVRRAPNAAQFIDPQTGQIKRPNAPPPPPGPGQGATSNGTGGVAPPPLTHQQLVAAGVPADAKDFSRLPNGAVEGYHDQQGVWHKLGAK